LGAAAMSLLVEPAPKRIALLTDFGAGPYIGQIQLSLSAICGAVPVIDLISDLVPFRPDLAAYLLPGLCRAMPPGTLYLCVVDPGVGSDRAVLAARVGDDWLLAPDNGLLLPMLRRAPEARVFRIDWRPDRLSASFHGRDLFAPLAARLCGGELPGTAATGPDALVGADWPPGRLVICYVDHFGNLITGRDADAVAPDQILVAGARRVSSARTFSDAAPGDAFWYRNAFGLVEIAVNQGRADVALGLTAGMTVTIAGA